jgi:hypothetical protein
LFANQPRDRVCHEGGRAALVHRFKCGRTLDAASGDGCALLWSALALSVGLQAGIEARCTPLDTTRCALTGAYGPDRAEHAMAITPGSANDPRPDLQQAVFARLVSQDGGVPWRCKSWEGQASDTPIVQERAHALLATLQGSPSLRSLGAAAPLAPAEQALHLAHLGFLPRLPGTLKRVAQVSTPARPWDLHNRRPNTNKRQGADSG